MKNNILYVVQWENNPALLSYGLVVSDLNWVSDKKPEGSFKCTAKFRYRQSGQGVTVYIEEYNRCRVVFDEPQRAVTPGQAVVFYQGGVCLGEGTIDSIYKDKKDIK